MEMEMDIILNDQEIDVSTLIDANKLASDVSPENMPTDKLLTEL